MRDFIIEIDSQSICRYCHKAVAENTTWASHQNGCIKHRFMNYVPFLVTCNVNVNASEDIFDVEYDLIETYLERAFETSSVLVTHIPNQGRNFVNIQAPAEPDEIRELEQYIYQQFCTQL